MQIELKRQQAELEAERLREAAMRESTEKNVLQEEYRIFDKNDRKCEMFLFFTCEFLSFSYEMKLTELERLKLHEQEKALAAKEWQDKAVRAQEEAEESKNQLKSELQRALNVDFEDVNETIELASSNPSVDESKFHARLTEAEKNKQLQQQLVVSKNFRISS